MICDLYNYARSFFNHNSYVHHHTRITSAWGYNKGVYVDVAQSILANLFSSLIIKYCLVCHALWLLIQMHKVTFCINVRHANPMCHQTFLNTWLTFMWLALFLNTGLTFVLNMWFMFIWFGKSNKSTWLGLGSGGMSGLGKQLPMVTYN